MVEEVDFGLPPEALFQAVHARPGSFFLDSALTANGLGSWSFIGFDPFLIFRATGDRITLVRNGSVEQRWGNAFAEMRRLLHQYRGAAPEEPRQIAGLPFSGGAVGVFSYELGAALQRIPRVARDEVAVPDMEFGFYEGVLAFELSSGRCFAAAHPMPGQNPVAIIRRMVRTVQEALSGRLEGISTWKPSAHDLQARLSKAEYLQAVRRIKDYIAAGDVYQVNLTQRFEASLSCHPYALYQRLRQRSPAPFASYLNTRDMQVVSSSPERFLRILDGRAETRPIKGTRPRGKTPLEDARLRQELMISSKDRAELLMIVDLERNDLGRICEFGSIQVDELFQLESHPTVHHLVGNVSGKLRPGCDVFTCMEAMFPGGSITGAPKIRAMQVIEEVEACRRQHYTGAIGYLGFDGNCDLNISIRTIFCAGDRASYHVGGGIVWDSDPESEYEETLAKGRAMRASLMSDE